MSASEARQSMSLSFLIRFAAIMAAFNIFGGLVSGPIVKWATALTIRTVTGLSEFFGLPIFSLSGGSLSAWGFKMAITTECTAIQYMAIFLGAVLCYPGRSFKHRIAGILTGAVSIFLFNVFRLVAIGYIGAKAPAHFDFVHTYLWQGMFVFFVFVLWFQWVNSARVFGLKFQGRVAAALAVLAAAVFLIRAFMPHYLRLLASAGDALFALLPFAKTISVSAKDGNVLYFYDGIASAYPLAFDVYHAAAFFAVMAFSLPGFRLRLFYALTAGLALLICLHTVYVLLGFVVADYYVQKHGYHYLLWYMRFISIVAPVLLGLWAKRLSLPKRASETHTTKNI